MEAGGGLCDGPPCRHCRRGRHAWDRPGRNGGLERVGGHIASDLGCRRADHLRGLVHHLVDRRVGGQSGSTVTIALPANTGLGSFNNGAAARSTSEPPRSATASATDTSASTPTVTCYLYGGDTVSASTAVTATLIGVTNPPAGSPTLAVSTTSDVTPVTSPTYTVTAAQPVSGVGVTITPRPRLPAG